MSHDNDKSRRPAVGLLAVLSVVAASAAIWFFPRSGPPTVPPDLLGEWTTLAPDYAGRAIEIRAADVTFRTGPEAGSRHIIEKLQRREVAGDVLYTIEYTDQGEPQGLSFYFIPRPKPELRLKNQRHLVWTR